MRASQKVVSNCACRRFMPTLLAPLQPQFHGPTYSHASTATVGSGRRPLTSSKFDPAVALNVTSKDVDGAVQLYDAWSESYDETLNRWGYEAPAVVAQLLKSHLPSHMHDGNVMDCGCGTGMSGEALQKEGFNAIVGIDCSSKSLRVCDNKETRPYTKTIVANLELTPLDRLPFETSSLSAIISVGVLSYINRYDVLFAEFARSVGPGGMVIFTHRTDLWDNDVNNIQTTAAEMNAWDLLYMSEASLYMPDNPVQMERDKRIRYHVYAVR